MCFRYIFWDKYLKKQYQKLQENYIKSPCMIFYDKCSNTSKLYLMHSKHYSVKIGSISFFSSSEIQKFHYILGFNAIGINSSFIYLSFFKCIVFFKFTMPGWKSNMNNSSRAIFIIISIIKVNIINIYLY